MALNPNSKQAIEYSERSGGLNLIDFGAYGDYEFLFAGLVDHVGPEETGGKEAYLVHVLVLGYKPSDGSEFEYSELEGKTLYFDQNPKGKAKPMAEAEWRCVLAAIMGQVPTDPAFDAVKAQKTLIKATEAGEVDPTGDPLPFKMSRRPKPGKGKHEGTTFSNDFYSPVSG